MWRRVQLRTDRRLLREAPLPLHTQCLHQCQPEKTNSPQRNWWLIIKWKTAVRVWCSPSLLLLQLPPQLPPSSYWTHKRQQEVNHELLLFLQHFTSSSLHHLLFFLVVAVASCQVVHGDGQEDVQQDVWCSLRTLMYVELYCRFTQFNFI